MTIVVAKTWCGVKETPLRSGKLSADVRRNERTLLEVRDQYLWAKDVSYQRSGNSSYPSPSTLILKGRAEAELVLEAAKVSKNARERAFAFICRCSFLQCDGEHLAYSKRHQDIFQFCMKYVEFLNLMMEEWRRWGLKEASRAVCDILLGGCFRAFIALFISQS